MDRGAWWATVQRVAKRWTGLSMNKANNAVIYKLWAFPGGSDGEEYVCNAGDPGSIPGSERSPGGGNGNPLPIFLPREFHGQRILEGYTVTVHGVAKNWTRLND